MHMTINVLVAEPINETTTAHTEYHIGDIGPCVVIVDQLR